MADTPNPLVDLLHEALSGVNLPVLAQSRQTQAPQYIGVTRDTPAPGSGLTSSGQLNGEDKLRLMEAAMRNGVGIRSISSVIHGLPQNRGAMYITPNRKDPKDTTATVRHETIHSLLDQAGVSDADYVNLLHSNPNRGDLARSFLMGNRGGDIPQELPAYLGQYHDTEMPGVNPAHRQGYLDQLAKMLLQKDPSGNTLQKYKSLVIQ